MREQVITPRASRVVAAPKVRAGATAQRTPPRRARASSAPSRPKGVDWKKVLRYVPLAAKLSLAIIVGVLVFAGYRAAAAASFFQVRSVDVEGTSRASRDEIRSAVQRMAGATGVWRADLDTISKDLRELPWVRTAVVSRVLPSGLRVRVTEREPRMIARTSQGRLVWVDDDGVTLGAATPGEHDFFIRGLDEGSDTHARQQNVERMKLALELKQDWEQTGLSSRVSEVNLDDLHEVRVQLAGDDARIEVRLNSGEDQSRSPNGATRDCVKLFRDALKTLDRERQTPRGQLVNYIVMTPGKPPIFGLPPAGKSRDRKETEAGHTGGAVRPRRVG
ncbi:MAG: FtsQ-type POTRA domain-containing protein [Acidobacteria bacterium]|nr:FtsQ-type POTRA domain-containing protein [Acidobacteriota bacterium]